MKEVLTKRFWQGVKATFDEALQGPPPGSEAKPDADPKPEEASKNDTPAPAPPSEAH